MEPANISRLFEKAKDRGIPLNGTFELSPMCNMDCSMCYVRRTKDEVMEAGGLLSSDEWYEIGKEAASNGMLFLLLTGGEPLLYPDFFGLYHRLKNLGLMIALNTNGTMLTEEMVRELSRNAPYRIQLTLYGASNETYGRLCQNKKGFDQVIRALDLLKKYSLTFKLNATMTPRNIDDIEEIYRIAREYDAYVQTSTYMFPPLRKGKDEFEKEDRFSPKEAGFYLARIDRLRYDGELLDKKKQMIKNEQKERDKIYEDCERSFKEPLGCRAGRSCFWISWQGKMTACGMMDEPDIDVRKEGIKKAFDLIREDTQKRFLPPKCTSCELRSACPVCGAAVFCEMDRNFDEPPSYLCEMTKSYVKEMGIYNEKV